MLELLKNSSTIINDAIAPTLPNAENSVSCHAFKLGISSEQDAKPSAWLRLTHYNDFAILDIKV